MKKAIAILTVSLISVSGYSQTLLNQKGVSVSYHYKYLGDEYSKDCKVELSSYEVNCTIKNTTGSAVKFKGMVSPKLDFPSKYCSKKSGGEYELSETTKSPWFFGYEHYMIGEERFPVDLLPNQERTGSPRTIYVEKGKPFPAPDWNIFFDFLSTVYQEKESPPKIESKPAEWGSWKSPDCFSGLQFRLKTVRGNNLNYQVHMYFEARSTYNQAVSFTFNLLDKNGKIHFSELRQISAGSKIEFVHKMDGDKITNFKMTNAKFSNGKDIPCGDGSKSSSNSNQASNTNQSNTNSVEQTNAEIGNINQYLTKIADNDPEKQRIMRELDIITGSSTLTDSQKAARIKMLTGQAKARVEQLDSQETARKAEEERQRKIEEERHNTMRDYTQKGDDAYNSGQYANAKMYYSSALTYATNDYDKQQIQAAISKAQLAIEAEARKQRVEQKQKVEQQNNAAAAGAIAGGIGILALLEDEESDEFFSAKFRFGLGMEWVPLLTNSSMKRDTRTGILAPIMLNVGFKLVLGNDKPISAHFTPEGGYGLMAFSTGSDGSMYSFGGTAGLHLGLKPEGMFKLVGEAGYLKRDGSYNYDGDVASGGTTANDEVYSGEFNYGITRLGGGVLFQVQEYDEVKFFIKPMYYFDKFSFARYSPFTKMLGIQLGSTKFGVIDLFYSSGYGIGGSIDYPQSFTPSKPNSWIISTERESYFQIRYSRQVKIK